MSLNSLYRPVAAALLCLVVVPLVGCGLESVPGGMAGTYEDLSLGLWLNAEPVYERAVEYDEQGQPLGISETWGSPQVPAVCLAGSVLNGRLESWNFVVVEDTELEATFRLGELELTLPALGPQYDTFATYGGDVVIDGRTVLVTADIFVDLVNPIDPLDYEAEETATVTMELRQTYGADCVEEGFVEGSK